MTRESLINDDWDEMVRRLGGEPLIAAVARETKAFLRPRRIRSAVDLLRLTLAYCLGHMGLRTTVAWSDAVGLASLSNPALLERLRNTGDWLACLIGHVLEQARPAVAQGRVIRIVDGTAVAKAGHHAKGTHGLWRVHAALSLPSDRFDFLEVTDESGGERLDRVPVVAGEIRMGDAGYFQVDQMGEVVQQGADVIIRASWRHARWLDDAEGAPLDLLALLAQNSPGGVIDRPVFLGRQKGKPPLAMRLVALRKPPAAIEEARRKARKAARKDGREPSAGTLLACEWVMLVTSLSKDTCPLEDVFKLYRLRWRIELAFKRLKSLIGLQSPPAKDERMARPWILAHLLMVLLVEPLTDEFGVSLC